MSVRFAPSPTGKFHIGNLRTAWISFQCSKILNIPWRLRFEDIDVDRSDKSFIQDQLNDLKMLGVYNSSDFFIQSQKKERHQELFKRAISKNAVYPCTCSRKEVQNALLNLARAPHDTPPLYNGHCRKNSPTHPKETTQSIAWRIKSKDESGKNDFIIARTSNLNLDDFVPAYHWACSIDDYDERHTLIVRAWDLENSLSPQKQIFNLIGSWEKPFPYPEVFHTSLVCSDNGHRLEKRTLGITLGELAQNGFNPASIIKCFEKSFDFKLALLSGSQPCGEKSKILLLKDLLC